MSRRYAPANAALALFAGVVTAVLVYIFYASDLRERIEEKLFDIRTRLAPGFVSPGGVAVVAIDDAAIAALEAGRGAEGGPGANLSYAGLLRVVDATLAAGPAGVVVLLPGQIFPYTSPGLAELGERGRADDRLIFGTFDLSAAGQTEVGVPRALAGAAGRVVKADVIRDFRRQPVRKLVVQQKGKLPFLAEYLARRFAHVSTFTEPSATRNKEGELMLELNYVSPRRLAQVRADAVVAGPGRAVLAGKLVFIGYTAYRPWTIAQQEATFVNSPWSAEGDDLKDGMPVVTLQAIAAVNALQRAWLRPAPAAVNVVQTVALSAAALVLWRLSVGLASLAFVGGWSLVLLAHAALFAFVRVHVPLTDAVLWSSMATLAGALWRMRIEGRLRAGQEARLSAERELAAVQDRFLNRFASELAALNGRLRATFERLTPVRAGSEALSGAYVRALGSCEELGDYLLGIQQFAALEEGALARPALTRVDLGEVIQGVVRQFDSRRLEADLALAVAGDAGAMALADRTLVGQILYNLVSNAVKYSPPGATVQITVTQAKAAVTVHVRDQGPGIAREFHERIFEKFYRVKDDYVYKLKGHGLGLYLSRYFAGLIGASLSVQSEPGRGADFQLTLIRAGAR